jgi:hypothetical protein
VADELLDRHLMNITLKTKIQVNGQQYDSPDALPPELRAAYEKALAGGAGPAANRDVKTFVSINGQRFSSADEIPAAEKKLYDDAMQLIRDSREVRTTADTTASSCPTTITAQSDTDTGLLTKRQIQLIIFVTGLIFAAVAVMLVLRR